MAQAEFYALFLMAREDEVKMVEIVINLTFCANDCLCPIFHFLGIPLYGLLHNNDRRVCSQVDDASLCAHPASHRPRL